MYLKDVVSIVYSIILQTHCYSAVFPSPLNSLGSPFASARCLIMLDLNEPIVRLSLCSDLGD